jgi:hypothetical protein
VNKPAEIGVATVDEPGIGSTVGYMRPRVSSREIFELHQLAGKCGRFINMHFRLTPGDDQATGQSFLARTSLAEKLGPNA